MISMPRISRRNLFLAGGAVAASMLTDTVYAQQIPRKQIPRLGLNFGTLIGFNLPLEEEIAIAAKAGYNDIEPWSRKIEPFIQNGGKLSELRKQINDLGLTVAGLVTFFPWLINDEAKRTAGIEQMKKEMDWAIQLGATRVAATASGATNERLDDFRVLGDRYRTILEIGDQIGVTPMLEIWGASQTLSSLADALAIAAWTEHPKAEFLLDVYHLYRGGSPFEALSLLSGSKIGMFHVNDYPADPPQTTIADRHRVYCGDGIAPLSQIFSILRCINYEGSLSFEVFNPTYWEAGDPLLVAKTGLEKLRRVVSSV